MRDIAPNRARAERLKADLAMIRGGFMAHLQEKHNAPFTIHLYCGFLGRIAEFVSRHGGSIRDLRRVDVSSVLRGYFPKWKTQPDRRCRAALHSWLKFRGRFEVISRHAPWQPVLDDYAQFMQVHRGLAVCTRQSYLRVARRFLAWQFRLTATDWRKIRPEHIWKFAELRIRGHKPVTVGDELSALRRFLLFMQVRGAVSPKLSQAIPRVANYGQLLCKEVLTEAQRRRFLASFERKSPEGRRDYTMALCMVDLGLRAIEICRLRLQDIDCSHKKMAVPPAKVGLGRELPIPAHVLKALRVYLKGRPTSEHDHLFVGHKMLAGRPLSSWAVASAMARAYRRCGFPRNWHGTHRLRRTFATRLCAHGADLKQIADLLGHRLVSTTNRYAQVDLSGLCALAQPWPK